MEAVELSGHSVLVTGAYGLLGSWLVRALLDAEARVVVVRRDDATGSALARMGLEQRVDVVHGDICADGLVARALGEYEVDTVFHLAAQTIVPTATRGPASTFETNIRGSWTVLEACRHHGAERVVVASSDKAYGPHRELPYREDHALQPVFPYDVSKAATDLLARSYWHTWQLPVAVTRFANLYGGGDTNRSRLVPEAVTAALAGRSPVVRSDGSPERDFLYVEDAVAAYLAIAGALGAGRGSRRGIQRRRRPATPRARCRRAHLPTRRHRRVPGCSWRRHPARRDRPAMGRLPETPGAHGLGAEGHARRGSAAHARLVPRAGVENLRKPFTSRLPGLPPLMSNHG